MGVANKKAYFSTQAHLFYIEEILLDYCVSVL